MVPITKTQPVETGLSIDVVRAVVSEVVGAQLAEVHRSIGDTAIRAAAGAFTQARLAGAQGLLHAVAALLAVRLLLMLALLGAFILSVMALHLGSYQAAGVLVAYALLIVMPLVWLERTSKVPHAT